MTPDAERAELVQRLTFHAAAFAAHALVMENLATRKRVPLSELRHVVEIADAARRALRERLEKMPHSKGCPDGADQP